MAQEKSMLVIDADSHLVEDFARLHELTDARYRSYAPRLLTQGPAEVVQIGGAYQAQAPGMTWGDTNSRRGLDSKSRKMRKWYESDQVGFDPKARLKLMDEIGVYGSVIFPSVGLGAGLIRIPEIAAGVCRGVNRYVADYCSADTDRMWPAASLPMMERNVAIAEARYAVKELGAKTVFGLSGVHGPEPIHHAYWDPFYEAIAELGVPFCTHGGGGAVRGGLASERFPGQYAPYHMTTHTIEAMLACVGMITYGVLDRFSTLKVGFFEAGAGWMPFWLHRMKEKHEHLGWLIPELKRSPVEIFAKQCAVTMEIEEALQAPTVGYLEGRGILWSSDLPHFDCEDGGSPRQLVENDELPLEHRRRVLALNAIEFFGLKVRVPA
jgi:predicted TIM-barrel fold metal-dependent hydrolase